jgi:hypothetical protein
MNSLGNGHKILFVFVPIDDDSAYKTMYDAGYFIPLSEK